jgi:glycerol uptake operon antiterminator
MKKHIYTFCLMIFLTIISCSAQEIFANQHNTWLQKAEEAKPALHETIVHPISIVKAVADKNAYQGWRYEKQDEIEKLYTTNFKELKSVTVDFGKHLTGYFSFHTQILTNCEDAPVRLKFTFAETPAELNTPLDPWKSNMSRAWMQDEIITLTHRAGKKAFIHFDFLDGVGKDRYGIRYLKNKGADGIITTKTNLIINAREEGLISVQRFFIIDTKAIQTAFDSINSSHPDMVEVMPGIMPEVITKFVDNVKPNVIAGGLISTKEHVASAINAGASAVSTTKEELWYL